MWKLFFVLRSPSELGRTFILHEWISAYNTTMASAVDHRGDHHGRWADIDGLLLRGGSLVGAGFEPGENVKSVLHDVVHVLVVGAGGLGCELLKDLGTIIRCVDG